ncbi:MAG: response regulator [Candidatus Hydrogenedentes bacterium]|nr:response regulator [Candidatus Hydrogenedentota bacterium]
MPKSRILVVDDEPDVVTLIERALTAEQFEVLSAYDGISALDLAETERPDLILLDIMMPMMSGYEVCEQLKTNPNTKGIPVVCLSSAHTADARARSLQVGAVTLVLKPFTSAELVAQIQRHLPAQEQPTS